MATLAKYMRKDDGTKYTPDEKNLHTLDDVMANAKEEAQIIQKATSGNLSAKHRGELSDRFPGFKMATPQDDVIACNYQKFTPDQNNNPSQKIVFNIQPTE